jgi:hypothetical protein
MKTIKLIITTVVATAMFSSCTFISNSFKIKGATETFVNALIEKKYDQCISLMTMTPGVNPNPDTLRAQLNNMNNMLLSHFGSKLNYTFLSAEKTVSSDASQSTPVGETIAFIQIDDSKYIGELRVLFDDKTQKIAGMYIMDVYEPMGSMLYFWLFGILVLGVLAFNIYMIVKLKRSDAPKKWIGYLLIILLNVPAFSFVSISGFHFGLLSFQIMLGISFSIAGYINSIFTFGFPLGSLIVLYKLKTTRYEVESTDPAMLYEKPEGMDDEL